jgi:hypothetical protein
MRGIHLNSAHSAERCAKNAAQNTDARPSYYTGRPETKDSLVIKKYINKMLFYIITTDIKTFFYITPLEIQALVVLCDEFLFACIAEICCQFSEPVFNYLLQFIDTHARVAQTLLQVCEEVKITWSQIWTIGRMEKSPSQSQQVAYFLINPCIMCMFPLACTIDTECTLL